jgi:hypothetical protein
MAYDVVVALHTHLTCVQADAQSQWFGLRLEQLESGEHCRFRTRERQEEPIAEGFHGATSSAAHDRSDSSLVPGEQLARFVVAVLGREAREAFEVGERDRQDVEHPFVRPVFRAGRQHLDRRQPKRGQRRRSLFDCALEQSFEYIHGSRGCELLIGRTVEPLAPDETELDGLGHPIRIALQQIGDADGSGTAQTMYYIGSDAAGVTRLCRHDRSALVHVGRHRSATLDIQ